MNVYPMKEAIVPTESCPCIKYSRIKVFRNRKGGIKQVRMERMMRTKNKKREINSEKQVKQANFFCQKKEKILE